MSKQKVLADREQVIAKSNDLIRKTRYSLTTQQQKIVLFCISKIKPGDKVDTEYKLDIKDLAAACGWNIQDGGYYYDRVKADLREMMKREFYMMPDGVERSLSWIGDAEIREKDGTVTITFNRNLQPYLFELKERYTMYKLKNVLAFRGKYSIRLYEILRSFTTQKAIDNGEEKEITLSVEDLRYQLDIKGYDRWADLNNYVLRPAVKEINELAEDINVSYQQISEHGRTISKVNFLITSAGLRQRTEAFITRKERLDHVKIRKGGGQRENNK